MALFNVDVREIRGPSAVVARCQGEIDAHSFEELEDALNGAIEAGALYIIVDLSGVSYISSAGMGILIASQGELEDRGGGFALVNLVPAVAQIFSSAGFDDLFLITRSTDNALHKLGI